MSGCFIEGVTIRVEGVGGVIIVLVFNSGEKIVLDFERVLMSRLADGAIFCSIEAHLEIWALVKTE
jgi:hypothetical protein